MEEEACLGSRVSIGHEKMVGTADKVVLACLIEIVVEVVVEQGGSLGGLDEDEADGVVLDAGIAQLLPLDGGLIVADVQSPDVVTFGINGFAVDGFPSETEWTHEEHVEKRGVYHRHQYGACPQRPCRDVDEPSPKPAALFPDCARGTLGGLALGGGRRVGLPGPAGGIVGSHRLCAVAEN